MIAPSLQYEETAYIDALQNGYSKAPVIEMQIPSTIDPSLAPPVPKFASTQVLVSSHFCVSLCSQGQARGQPLLSALQPHSPEREELG